ncbi:MAG: C25 family cysteine peptidase [Candidatus Poribacteria bacterium]|nr:C25 family cysteine peptidase [Candidatus Poribacteria bacterium]
MQPIYSRLLCPFLFLFCFIEPTWAESIIRTVYADSTSLVVEFKLPELRFSEVVDGGDTYSQVTFDGSHHTLKDGYPQLPTYSQLIGIPVREVPQATVINSQFDTRPTEKILPVQADLVRESESSHVPRSVRNEMNTDFYGKNRFYPTHLVEIIPIGFIRDQRVALLKIQPIQYNPRLSRLKIYRSMQIRVEFNQPTHSGSQAFTTYQPSRPFEELFQSRLLNYNQSKAWRMPRQSQAQFASTFSEGEMEQRYRISVKLTGMYRIAYSRLQRAGDPSSIDLNTIKLENNGRMVGVYIFDKAEDGKFDREDSIIFYGQAIVGDKYTDTNVYWLSWNSLESSRVGVSDAQLKTRGIRLPIAFLKRERFERDIFHDALEAADADSGDADHYFWARFKSGEDKPFPIDLPGAVPRELIHRSATVRVKLQGVSLFTHKARILLNKKWIARTQDWRRQDDILTIHEFDQRRFLVHHTTNELTVIADPNPRVSTDGIEFYLDWFEFDYWHSFKALSGSLEFNSITEPESNGIVQYRVENLRNSEVDVYKIRNGSIVEKMVNGRISQNANEDFQIVFEDVVTQPTSYIVLDSSAYENASIVPAKPQTLKNPANQADYIVISHRNFLESIQPLVEFRRSQGNSVIVADIDDVYDQFNYGVFNPYAIQHFLRYAYTSWRQPAPSYVLLVGDAHWDYKGASREYWRLVGKRFTLPPIYVPTIHGWAPVSGETAMDHRFVTVSGDDTLPDMFIGRLSVQRSDELDDMVKKLIDYEQNPNVGVWQRTLAQVSDDEKSNSIDWIFEDSRNRIIKEYIPIAFDTREIYLRKIGSPERTNRLILNSIDEGLLILEYAGHGGSETWADEGIFRIENIPGMRNQYLPFVITTTCLNGQFDRPLEYGYRSLSEEFMMGLHAAVGTLSATRLTFATANAAFDEDLFDSIFNVKPATLGAITADAKIKFIGEAASKNRGSWIPGAEQYILFGDPATRLAFPDMKIKVELSDIALNPNKQLVIKQNTIGNQEFNIATGERRFITATDFSTERLSAAVVFANSFDEDPYNDLSARQDQLNVWKGEFGAIRFDLPLGVTAGRGIVRLFASDGERTALGGAEFWTEQPRIHDVREELDRESANALNLRVQIVDDAGQAGVESVDVVWNDTVLYKTRTTPMIPDPQFSAPVSDGGRWWRLQTPIPLPPAERSVIYHILATDKDNNVVYYPSEKERKTVKVPADANLAIVPNSLDAPSIRYVRLEDSNMPVLKVDLINDGGDDVPVDVEVWFSEGDPDRNVDHQIDPDANIIGKVEVNTYEWVPGDTVHQQATAILPLNEPLSRGHHEIHVFVDPTPPDQNSENRVFGVLDETRSADNREVISIDVNEFAFQPENELTCASLDQVFEAFFTVDALEPTTLSINALDAPISTQPGLRFVAIPQPANEQNTLVRQYAGASQAYVINLPSSDSQLLRPVEVRFRFDNDHLHDLGILNPGDVNNQDNLLSRMGIYSWREQTKTWKRLASRIRYEENGSLYREKFLAPAQNRNRNPYELLDSQIRIDSELTPIGMWIIFFLDSDRYLVLFRDADNSTVNQVGAIGKPGQIFIINEFGVRVEIKRVEEVDIGRPFEFGDVLTFETKLDRFERLVLSEIRNSNRGNGTPELNLRVGSEDNFRSGDWLILFRDNQTFEIHDRLNLSDGKISGDVLLGSVGEPLYMSDPGVEVLITPGEEPFAFGDKFKIGTKTVSIVTAEAAKFSPFALMASSDTRSPRIRMWIEGEALVSGSVIPSRPQISMILDDSNGIDMDAFRFVVGKNGGPFKEITEFTITNPEQVAPVTIFYAPVLSVGRYLYRIWAKDLNGNELRHDGGYNEFTLYVEEPPDLEPPAAEIRLNQEILTDSLIVLEQPEIEVQLTDNRAIESNTIQLSFAKVGEELSSIPREAYDLVFDEAQPDQATIIYAPSLANGEYQIQTFASDTSGNTYEGEELRFQLDEEVEIEDIRNVPNPIRTGTFFTYNFVQRPEQVTIKIYSISGKLVRTIEDASSTRGYNETYWDARDESGSRLSNGTYFYKVTVEAENGAMERVGRLAILR